MKNPAQQAEVDRLAALLLAHMEKSDDPQTEHFKAALATWRQRPLTQPLSLRERVARSTDAKRWSTSRVRERAKVECRARTRDLISDNLHIKLN
ncbi:MAG TPA: hypothetical protein VGJ26_01615 [Pirellulales bacterium]